MAINTEVAVFWTVMACNYIVGNQDFGGPH
jgi:hypothetical protein